MQQNLNYPSLYSSAVDNRYFPPEYLARYSSLTSAYYPEHAASAYAASAYIGNSYFSAAAAEHTAAATSPSAARPTALGLAAYDRYPIEAAAASAAAAHAAGEKAVAGHHDSKYFEGAAQPLGVGLGKDENGLEDKDREAGVNAGRKHAEKDVKSEPVHHVYDYNVTRKEGD